MIIAHPGAAIQVDISTTFNPANSMRVSLFLATAILAGRKDGVSADYCVAA